MSTLSSLFFLKIGVAKTKGHGGLIIPRAAFLVFNPARLYRFLRAIAFAAWFRPDTGKAEFLGPMGNNPRTPSSSVDAELVGVARQNSYVRVLVVEIELGRPGVDFPVVT
jgi:hypothetical protein